MIVSCVSHKDSGFTSQTHSRRAQSSCHCGIESCIFHSALLGVDQKTGWGGEGGGLRNVPDWEGGARKGLEQGGRLAPTTWEEARKAGRAGAGPLSLPSSPHTPPQLPAGPPILTSRIHPRASPSSLPVQATVSLTGGFGTSLPTISGLSGFCP